MKKNLKSKKNNNKIAIIFSFVIILIVGFLFYNFILKQNDIEKSQSQISSNSESTTTQVTDTTFTMTAIGDVMCHNGMLIIKNQILMIFLMYSKILVITYKIQTFLLEI